MFHLLFLDNLLIFQSIVFSKYLGDRLLMLKFGDINCVCLQNWAAENGTEILNLYMNPGKYDFGLEMENVSVDDSGHILDLIRL